jgi:hypothetical protein
MTAKLSSTVVALPYKQFVRVDFQFEVVMSDLGIAGAINYSQRSSMRYQSRERGYRGRTSSE